MIFAKPNGDLIEIRFAVTKKEQFSEYVEKIKKIYGRQYVPSGNDHYWTIPISQQSYLKSLFDRSEIEWQQEEVKIIPKNISDDPMYLDELKLTPYPFQAIGMNFLCDTKKCIIADEMGLGKAQPLTSKILTPDGWVTMGEVRLGMNIINSKGTISQIIGIYPQGIKDIYKVTFSDGSSTECCDEHLWNINTTTRNFRKRPYMIKQLKDFKDNLQFQNGNNKYYIPIANPVKSFSEKQLTLDPWMLGVTLGNGVIGNTLYGISTTEEYIINKIQLLINSNHYLRFGDNGTIYISSKEGKKGNNKYLNILKNFKLLGCKSHDKFIPKEYLYSDLNSRVSLLQGLMDTDGSVNKSDNHLEYTTVSNQLAKDIQELVWSLGGLCKIYIKDTSWTYNGEKKYSKANKLSIVLPNEILPFSLPRKAEIYKPRKKYLPTRAIVSVEYVGKKEAQCIMVNSKDHLYITDNYILTHNTIQTIGAAYKLYRKGLIKQVLVICPSALKYQWGEEIKKFIDTEKYGIDYIIIDGTKKQRVEDYDYIHENDVLYTIINYELVLNDIDYLLEFDWDVIALDEVHRIRNWKSKTSQAINKLDADYKWGATGTPVQNKPEELFNIFGFIDSKILGNWWQFRNNHIIIGEKFGQQNMVLGYKKLGWLHEKISPYMLRRLKKDVAPELPEMIISNFYVEMYPEQYTLHERVREDLFNTIKEISQYTERDENGNIIKQHPKADSILGLFAMLQGICDTPYLLEMSDSKMASSYKIGGKLKSPKIDELIDILTDFINSYEPENAPLKYKGLGPKAVIFTQFDRMRELVVQGISKLGKCEIINGKLDAKKKNEALVRFQTDPNIRFLVCTDAANYGLNISQANLLISVDLPWNPAIWQQRNARIHRIDSEYKNINIINLISKDGLDERILDVLYNKQDMAAAIVESRDEEKQHISSLTSNMMSKLLKAKKKEKKDEQ